MLDKLDISSNYELTWDERPTPAPPPYLILPDSHFVQTIKKNLAYEVGQAVEFVLAHSVADSNHFTVYGNVPTLIFGPQGGNTCEANEYVLIISLVPIARTCLQSVLELIGPKT